MTLEKRSWETRVFSVDVRPAMRKSDSIGYLVSVDALPPDGVNISGESNSDGVVSFIAAGGAAGERYTVRIRFATQGTPEQMLEAVVGLSVVG